MLIRFGPGFGPGLALKILQISQSFGGILREFHHFSIKFDENVEQSMKMMK